MPEDHQKYLKWDGNRFISWAEKIGPHAVMTIKSILASYRVEQQGYKKLSGPFKAGRPVFRGAPGRGL